MSRPKTFFAIILALMIISSSLLICVRIDSISSEEECTAVIVTGTASEGGYAILAKNRDVSTSNSAQSPVYTPSSSGIYASIMVSSYWMGMNEKGLAIENTVVSELEYDSSRMSNGVLNRWIVQHCATVDEVCFELNNSAGAIGPGKRAGGTCIGVVDSLGKGAFIEVSDEGAYARFIVDGFDSEANHARYYPGYAKGPSGRYQYALDSLNRIYEEKGVISYGDVVQKVMRYVNFKEQGNLPFNVTGEIPNDSTQSSFVAVSGNAAYDGKLNCFWGEYGNNPIVGIYVPSIVFAGTPPAQTQKLYSRVLEKRVYAKNRGSNYLPERVREIQSYTFAAENYTFEKYESLVSSIPEGLNDSELSSTLNDYVVDSVNYATTTYSQLTSDGFDSGNFSAWSGTSVSNGETAAVTNTIQVDGQYCAIFTSNGNGVNENAYCYKSIGSLAELYVRSYFYVSQSGIVDSGDRFYLIALNAGSNTVSYAGWRKTSGVVKWFLSIKSGTTTLVAYSTTSPSLNQWYCVELHFKKNSSAGLGELWINGTKACSITRKNTSAYGNTTQVRIGLPALYSCANTSVIVDCVEIATSYIAQEY